MAGFGSFGRSSFGGKRPIIERAPVGSAPGVGSTVKDHDSRNPKKEDDVPQARTAPPPVAVPKPSTPPSPPRGFGFNRRPPVVTSPARPAVPAPKPAPVVEASAATMASTRPKPAQVAPAAKPAQSAAPKPGLRRAGGLASAASKPNPAVTPKSSPSAATPRSGSDTSTGSALRRRGGLASSAGAQDPGPSTSPGGSSTPGRSGGSGLRRRGGLSGAESNSGGVTRPVHEAVGPAQGVGSSAGRRSRNYDMGPQGGAPSNHQTGRGPVQQSGVDSDGLPPRINWGDPLMPQVAPPSEGSPFMRFEGWVHQGGWIDENSFESPEDARLYEARLLRLAHEMYRGERPDIYDEFQKLENQAVYAMTGYRM